MRNKLVDIINIEAIIGCLVQTFESFCQRISNRLFGILVHPCSDCNRNNRNDNACNSHRRIEMDRIRFTIRTDEVSERNKSGSTSYYCQEHQRESHSQRTFMWCVVCVEFFVFLAPENTVVQTEHIESSHRSNYCHYPSHYRAVLEASSQNFIFREEARERRNTGNSKTSNQECPVSDRHIFA